MRVKLPSPEPGAEVIELDVVRESKLSARLKKQCLHNRVRADPVLCELLCNDCDTKLSPIEWLCRLAEELGRVQHLYQSYREAKAQYEGKKRCRCEHCNRLTRVTPLSAAEVRALKAGP